ncbi:hypothetical protein ACHHYP_09031 [Achlya hypogyna]|uniref:PX domain-containing protein n=1 Tax=Achlya hypogyna TaxID=1202772 RepID=A0A1V9ZJP1_ACHHY|nr:hypothetical protein ACHHYP_09031 [Achlya hypogyna]
MESDDDYSRDSYGSRSGSTLAIEASRITRSRTSSQDSVKFVPTRAQVVPVWARHARALGHLQSVAVGTQAVDVRQKRAAVFYVLDVYQVLPPLGSITSLQPCVEPAYQLRRRYSECHTFRRQLIELVKPRDHRRDCDYCQGLFLFLVSAKFPMRWPRALDGLRVWRQAIVCRRQIGLETWFNRLLLITHKSVVPVGTCEASILVLCELASFFLEPPPSESD